MKQTAANLETLLKNLSSIRNLQARLSSMYLSEYDFTPNELNILILLSNNPTIDTAKELALYLRVSKGLICRSLDHLTDMRLLCTQADSHDHRIQHLRLDETAQPIIRQIRKVSTEFGNKILDGIQEADLKAAERVFDKIRENIRMLEEEQK